ncbi:MAG: hypothetical protein P4L31_05665 [Candidatus Babeliales bacterium]|nr:hypothetical protein [Candidatus Babeliales bacterium]
MTNAIGKITIILICLAFSCHGQQPSHWQFSDDFLQKLENNTSLYHNTIQPIFASDWAQDDSALPQAYLIAQETHETDEQPIPTPQSLLSTANAYQLIDSVTIGYTFINIYGAYQTLHSTHQSSSIMSLMLGKHITFFMSCLETTCKALLYKTVAQCIVLCAEGNIIDLVSGGLQKVAHFVF